MSTIIDISPFEQALKEFRASLAPQEQSIFTQCHSADELLRHVEDLGSLKKFQRRSRMIQRVSQFSNSLSHYFDVIGILVQSHPEFAALAWGAFRLVLQLASNFQEFFDKLTKTLLRLSDALPSYEELGLSLRGIRRDTLQPYSASSRLIISLTKVYVDIFIFLQSVVRIFTKKDNSNRSKVAIIGTLFWKPFDLRFDDILDTMQHHRKLLKTEMFLYAHQTTCRKISEEHEMLKKELQGISGASSKQHDRCEEIFRSIEDLATTQAKAERHFSTTERILEDLSLKLSARIDSAAKTVDDTLRSHLKASVEDRVKVWLSAPEYARDLEIVRDSREVGTSQWILHHSLFQQWLRRSDHSQADSSKFRNNSIWIQGNPGFGKTVLAGAVIDELEDRTSMASRVLYFFFRREPTLDNSTALYRSLLTQILGHCDDDEVLDRFAFAMKYSPTSQPTGTRKELFELLLLCTETMDSHYIVIDGIDECLDNENLVNDLARLGFQSNTVLLSRPNIKALQEKGLRYQPIDIGRSNSGDIELFLKRKLEGLASRDMLPEDASIEEYTRHLTLGADGMFLWARLMMEYLDSEALDDHDRHNTILAVSMPERLSSMYMRIITLITQGPAANRDMAKWIILWLTYARRPLTAVELEESTKLLGDGKHSRSVRRDFGKAVVMACASLVEKATLWNNITCFRFIHSTVTEYFQALFTEDGMSQLPPDVRAEVTSIATLTPHSEVCRSCLQYMLYHMPDSSLSDALKDSPAKRIAMKDMEVAFPFSRYVTVLWIHHLAQTQDELITSIRSNQAATNTIQSFIDALFRFLCQDNFLKVWIEATYILAHDHSHSVDVLSTWSNSMNANRASIAGYHAKMTDILRIAEALPQYIRKLDQYWGSSLRAYPGRIWTWDEINAFTPSPVPRDTSATVRVLPSISPSQAGTALSNQYLCKISESTSEFVGILSIWTSHNFETCYRRGFWFPKILTDECVEGWQARYEIWSMDGSPRRICSKTILLDKTEFSLGDPIPIAISSDLRQLAILRTIHWLEPVEIGTQAVLQSAVLDLNLDAYSTRMWDTLLYTDDHADRIGHPALYTYWIRFSRSGNYIFFMDQQTVAIFSLHLHAHRGPSLVSFYGDAHDYVPMDFSHPKWRSRLFRNDEESRDWNFFDSTKPEESLASRNSEPLRQLNVHFYSDKPLVAYCTGRYVFLWAFKNAQSRPMLCYKTPHASVSYPEHIAFTSNSNQLIIKERDSELPIILPLPDAIINALEDEVANLANNDEDRKRHRDSPSTESTDFNLSSFRPLGHSLSSSAYVQIMASGDSLGFTPIASPNSASVLLWRDTAKGFEQQKLEIINFPAWEGIQSVTTSMKLPEPGESAVTLVLNKAVQAENSFGTAEIERFPAVITREVASLRPRPVDNTEDQRKRLQEGLEEQRGKRRRLTERTEGENAE